MKRFVITISCLLAAALLVLAVYYVGGAHIVLDSDAPLTVSFRTEGDAVQVAGDTGWETLEIRGVDLGSSLPGTWSTDYAPDEETYLRWFGEIQAMGANTLRVYAVQNEDFYKALRSFNTGSDTPLYLLQGIWVDDYAQNSHVDGYDDDFRQQLISDCKTAVDVIHGKRFLLTNDANGSSGFFRTDVSEWVLGYVIGAEWTDVTVAYTDEKYPEMPAYEGIYLSSSDEATPFETMLAEVGDTLIGYETGRYRQQRVVTFASGRTTDPFIYPEDITEFFRKCAAIDVEHLRQEEGFEAGIAAGHSVYSYDLDYLSVMSPDQWQSLTDAPVDFSDCDGSLGVTDTYLAYLKLLNGHHSVPVVVLAFGASSGRGLAQYNESSSLQEGHFSETEQGRALTTCWKAIDSAGCAGGCVFSWQDEWHKRTWNTMFAIDFSRTAYWSDAQSSDQHFGLLAFDAGETTICTVDGDSGEWADIQPVVTYEDGSVLRMQYDERYLYFLIEKPNLQWGEDTLYLPIDTTQKTGVAACPALGLQFDRAVDFIVKLHTAGDSALLVQSRYHDIHANFEQEITGRDAYIDPPNKDTVRFEVAEMAIKDTAVQFQTEMASLDAFPTGELRMGNGDPNAVNYDSLTDFAVGDGVIELRLPWALLNFSDPSRMEIHDDYYDGNYGVEFIRLKSMAVGLGDGSDVITMADFPLKGWGNDVTWHERLKPAYYAMQRCWKGASG